MIGRRSTRVQRFVAYLKNAIARVPALSKDAHPNFVKAQLPPSAFTKSGPGITRQLRTALRRLTQEQREVAHRKGWDKNLLRRSPIRYNPKTGKLIGGGKLQMRKP